MNDHELRHIYQGLMTRAAPERAGCPAPEQVMRLAAGELPEAERLDALEHVSACSSCRAELDLAAAVTAAGVGLERRSIRMPWLALAASLVLLAGGVTLWRSAGAPRDVVRGGDERVTLVAPIGRVPRVEQLVWGAIPGATFEVEVIDPAGAVAFSATTTDTTAGIAAAGLKPGTEYRWRVNALLPDGTRRRSAAEPLVIRP